MVLLDQIRKQRNEIDYSGDEVSNTLANEAVHHAELLPNVSSIGSENIDRSSRPGPKTMNRLLQAIAFAADKHRDQRRKDATASPYINHPDRAGQRARQRRRRR